MRTPLPHDTPSIPPISAVRSLWMTGPPRRFRPANIGMQDIQFIQ
jgi:hypothetical protein